MGIFLEIQGQIVLGYILRRSGSAIIPFFNFVNFKSALSPFLSLSSML